MKLALPAVAGMMFCCPAFALDLGYGIAQQIPTDPVPRVSSGVELRALFGGEHGDKWSVWLGAQPVRYTKEWVAYGVPVLKIPGYSYAGFLRRFNKRLNGPIVLFAGTGISYRNAETCIYTGSYCFKGDPFVSSQWSFAQELGFKWRAVEISVGHLSTGGISELNHGLNLLRFTLLGHIGKRK